MAFWTQGSKVVEEMADQDVISPALAGRKRTREKIVETSEWESMVVVLRWGLSLLDEAPADGVGNGSCVILKGDLCALFDSDVDFATFTFQFGDVIAEGGDESGLGRFLGRR